MCISWCPLAAIGQITDYNTGNAVDVSGDDETIVTFIPSQGTNQEVRVSII